MFNFYFDVSGCLFNITWGDHIRTEYATKASVRNMLDVLCDSKKSDIYILSTISALMMWRFRQVLLLPLTKRSCSVTGNMSTVPLKSVNADFGKNNHFPNFSIHFFLNLHFFLQTNGWWSELKLIQLSSLFDFDLFFNSVIRQILCHSTLFLFSRFHFNF